MDKKYQTAISEMAQASRETNQTYCKTLFFYHILILRLSS